MTIPESIREDLKDDEKLLWHGQPATDFLFVPYDWWALAALIVLLTIGASMFFLRVSISGFDLFSLLLLIMLSVPTTLFCVRIPFDMMKRRNTYYFVTDKRVAIKIDTFLDRKVTSKKYDAQFMMTPIDAPKGTTTIYFGSTSAFWDYFYPPNYPLTDMFQPPAFMFIDNAVHVMDLIINAKLALANSAR